MAEFTLPELGENITAGDVVRVLVSPGDAIAKEQPVLELETDKATIEVPSSVSGTIKDVRVKQGDRIKVGQVVLTVEDGGAAAAPGKPKGEAGGDTTDRPKAQPTGAPEEGGMSQQAPEASAESGGGARKGRAERDRGAVDSAPDRTVKEAPEDEAADVRPKRGEVVDIGRGVRAPAPPAAPEAPADEDGPAPPAAPSVRRLARELGVDIRRVNGSGPGGRINPEDVQEFVRRAIAGGGGAWPPPLRCPISRSGERSSASR